MLFPKIYSYKNRGDKYRHRNVYQSKVASSAAFCQLAILLDTLHENNKKGLIHSI